MTRSSKCWVFRMCLESTLITALITTCPLLDEVPGFLSVTGCTGLGRLD